MEKEVDAKMRFVGIVSRFGLKNVPQVSRGIHFALTASVYLFPVASLPS